MTLSRLAAALAALLALTGAAHAQRTPLYQSGTLTPGDLFKGSSNGIAERAPGLTGDTLGKGVNPFSITDALGLGVCANSAATTGQYNAVCIGHDASGNGLITLDSYGGLGAKEIYVRKNGVLMSLPGGTTGLALDVTGSYYQAGVSGQLFPIYATQTATTATSGNGSPTITVTSATGIGVGDLIGASFVPFGTYVNALVGTTVTMSANATATNATPVAATFGQDRFSTPGNSILTNTIAAQVGQFGSAARGHSTWPGRLTAALDLSWSSVYSISPIGQTAGTFATRSSDNAFAGSNTIAQILLCTADNPSIELFTWCTYAESHLVATAVQTSHIQHEGSLNNKWTISGDEDPYNINPSIAVRNMRLDNGIAQQSNPATVALDIVNNASGLGGGTYRTGIIFHETALDFTGPRDSAPAIAMAAKHSIDWFTSNGGVASWRIWADGGSPTTFRMRDIANSLDFLTIDAATGILVLGETNKNTLMRGPLQLTPYVVSALPTCNAGLNGAVAFATDLTTPTYGAVLTGGGAVRRVVHCDATSWKS